MALVSILVARVADFAARELAGAARTAKPEAQTTMHATRVRFAAVRTRFAVARERCAVARTADSASCERNWLTALPNAATPTGSRVAPIRSAAAPGGVIVLAVSFFVLS